MAEEGQEQSNFETQVESFLTKELAPEGQEILNLGGSEIVKVADDKLDLPDPLNEPGDKREETLGDPNNVRRTYMTEREDTFFVATLKNTPKGWQVISRDLVRFGPDALKSFKQGMDE